MVDYEKTGTINSWTKIALNEEIIPTSPCVCVLKHQWWTNYAVVQWELCDGCIATFINDDDSAHPIDYINGVRVLAPDGTGTNSDFSVVAESWWCWMIKIVVEWNNLLPPSSTLRYMLFPRYWLEPSK